jgi:hypothetical protein
LRLASGFRPARSLDGGNKIGNAALAFGRAVGRFQGLDSCDPGWQMNDDPASEATVKGAMMALFFQQQKLKGQE